MIRVLIVDDQRLMRDGLVTLLGLEADIQVVGALQNGREAVDWLRQDAADVVLMDIRMPVLSGIEATREIVGTHDAVKVLMLTTFEEQDDVMNALAAGAVGYLLKDMPAEEIAQAIRTALAGGAVLPPRVAKTFLAAVQFPTASRSPVPAEDQAVDSGLFTDRERDILDCLATGMSNREIAAALYVTEGTVKNHVSNLLTKLDLRDRTQVALYAVRHGFGRKG